MKRLSTLLISVVLTLGVATVCSQAVDTTLTPTSQNRHVVKKSVKSHHNHHHGKKKASAPPAPATPPVTK